VLLAALVLYLGEVYRCWRLEPTGDALFDRCAQAVVEKQAWRLFSGNDTLGTALPDHLLAEWEDDFGDDPRYWQLRYYSIGLAGDRQKFEAMLGPAQDHELVDEQVRTRLDATLREAVDRGCADARIYLQLYMLHTRFHKTDYSAEQLTEYFGWLQTAAELEPDYAWPHYYIAMHYVQHAGDTNEGRELALQHLELGNAAADTSLPCVFPASFVNDYVAGNGALPGNAVVSGWTMLNGWAFTPYDSLYEGLRIKQCGKRIVELDKESRDLVLLEEYLGLLCRWGLADGSEMLDWMRISTAFSYVNDYLVVDVIPERDPGEREMLWRLCKRMRGLWHDILRGIGDEQLESMRLFWPYRRAGEEWRGVTGRYLIWHYGPSHLNYALEAQRYLDGQPGEDGVREDLRYIDRFDFETMHFTVGAPVIQSSGQ